MREFFVIRYVRSQHYSQIEPTGDEAFLDGTSVGFDHVDLDVRESPDKSSEMIGNKVACYSITDRKI